MYAYDVETNTRPRCAAPLPQRTQENRKWVLEDGRYKYNPDYVDPAPWLNLENFVSAQVAIGSLAVTPAVPALTARGTGLMNSNNIMRWGFNWKGSAKDGQTVFRWAVGKWHLLDF